MFDALEASPHIVEENGDSIAAQDLVDELDTIFFRISQLEARAASLLRQAGESGAHRRDGYSSPTAMLKHRMSLHPGEAHRIVNRANGLGDAPLASLAHEKGLLSGA
jgi:hypothetical protein